MASTLTFKLVTVDGAPADPPSFTTGPVPVRLGGECCPILRGVAPGGAGNERDPDRARQHGQSGKCARCGRDRERCRSLVGTDHSIEQIERQGAGRIVRELQIPNCGGVDQTAGGGIELTSGYVQGRGDMTVAFDQTRPALSMGHAIVVLELGVERTTGGCTGGKRDCREYAEREGRKKEKTSHPLTSCR